jgi:hypothetical protein
MKSMFRPKRPIADSDVETLRAQLGEALGRIERLEHALQGIYGPHVLGGVPSTAAPADEPQLRRTRAVAVIGPVASGFFG